jgi:hypothetical protein
MADLSRLQLNGMSAATNRNTWEDPYLFDSDFGFKAKLAAFTFDYDGYTKFEAGARFDLTRKLSKRYEVD